MDLDLQITRKHPVYIDAMYDTRRLGLAPELDKYVYYGE